MPTVQRNHPPSTTTLSPSIIVCSTTSQYTHWTAVPQGHCTGEGQEGWGWVAGGSRVGNEHLETTWVERAWLGAHPPTPWQMVGSLWGAWGVGALGAGTLHHPPLPHQAHALGRWGRRGHPSTLPSLSCPQMTASTPPLRSCKWRSPLKTSIWKHLVSSHTHKALCLQVAWQNPCLDFQCASPNHV